jgi:hypothetical protein
MNQLTFRDLKKRVSLEIVQQNELFVRVHNKPFCMIIMLSTDHIYF